MGLVERLQDLPQRPVAGIVVVNLVPVLGVVLLDWELGLVLLLFWLENVAVGFYGILKMAIIARWAALFLVPFFLIHFGMFSTVHLAVLLLFVAHDAQGIAGFLRQNAWAMAVVGIGLLVSHGLSFRDNFLRREREALDPVSVMGHAYKRVVVLHVTIVLGAVPVVVLGEPTWALFLLALLKLAVDLASHAAAHRQPPAAAPGAT